MDIDRIRKKIDEVDYEILKLINERIELGLQTRKFKSFIYDEKREKQVLMQIKKHSRSFGFIQESFVEEFFKVVIKECRKVQNRKN